MRLLHVTAKKRFAELSGEVLKVAKRFYLLLSSIVLLFLNYVIKKISVD